MSIPQAPDSDPLSTHLGAHPTATDLYRRAREIGMPSSSLLDRMDVGDRTDGSAVAAWELLERAAVDLRDRRG